MKYRIVATSTYSEEHIVEADNAESARAHVFAMGTDPIRVDYVTTEITELEEIEDE